MKALITALALLSFVAASTIPVTASAQTEPQTNQATPKKTTKTTKKKPVKKVAQKKKSTTTKKKTTTQKPT